MAVILWQPTTMHVLEVWYSRSRVMLLFTDSGGHGIRHRGVFCLVRFFGSGQIAVIVAASLLIGVRSMSRMSWKYIQMYGLDLALNPIDGLGADIAKGKTARCILVVVRCWGHAWCCAHASPGGHRDGGWAGQGVKGRRVSLLGIMSDEP